MNTNCFQTLVWTANPDGLDQTEAAGPSNLQCQRLFTVLTHCLRKCNAFGLGTWPKGLATVADLCQHDWACPGAADGGAGDGRGQKSGGTRLDLTNTGDWGGLRAECHALLTVCPTPPPREVVLECLPKGGGRPCLEIQPGWEAPLASGKRGLTGADW